MKMNLQLPLKQHGLCCICYWQKANFKDGNVFLLRCEEGESLSWWFSLIKYNQILPLSATGEMQLTSKRGAAGCALLAHAQGAGSDG